MVWVAFATEFVFKTSAHPKPFGFAQERWLDVAIVVLPMLEFVLTKWVDAAPLARSCSAPGGLSRQNNSPGCSASTGSRGLPRRRAAVLLLGMVNRLLGNTPEKRLTQLEEQIADLEEQLKEAKQEAEELKALIARRKPAQNLPPRPPSLKGRGKTKHTPTMHTAPHCLLPLPFREGGRGG